MKLRAQYWRHGSKFNIRQLLNKPSLALVEKTEQVSWGPITCCYVVRLLFRPAFSSFLVPSSYRLAGLAPYDRVSWCSSRHAWMDGWVMTGEEEEEEEEEGRSGGSKLGTRGHSLTRRRTKRKKKKRKEKERKKRKKKRQKKRSPITSSCSKP